jgi:putative oxidoreductase
MVNAIQFFLCRLWIASSQGLLAMTARGCAGRGEAAAVGGEFAMFENLILLVSRLLLAWIFVHEGVYLAINFDAASSGMAKLGVPAHLLVLTIALQLAAGTAIAAGWHARVGAAALGLFCLATAILFHTNFANRNELLHFEKDLAISGGMLLLTLRGAGALSIEGLLRAGRPMPVISG